eukprot:TRINITY_DN12040_c2_g1_i1.p1 TRINITY_DN12040_c2_g1~~TRINITY_DN12040_c2_g1_i1.p1  ORF type:complete len:310 (-),score=-10.24 TRINITY_DN12040_c2_g1_i1:100-1029(-)
MHKIYFKKVLHLKRAKFISIFNFTFYFLFFKKGKSQNVTVYSQQQKKIQTTNLYKDILIKIKIFYVINMILYNLVETKQKKVIFRYKCTQIFSIQYFYLFSSIEHIQLKIKYNFGKQNKINQTNIKGGYVHIHIYILLDAVQIDAARNNQYYHLNSETANVAKLRFDAVTLNQCKTLHEYNRFNYKCICKGRVNKYESQISMSLESILGQQFPSTLSMFFHFQLPVLFPSIQIDTNVHDAMSAHATKASKTLVSLAKQQFFRQTNGRSTHNQKGQTDGQNQQKLLSVHFYLDLYLFEQERKRSDLQQIK